MFDTIYNRFNPEKSLPYSKVKQLRLRASILIRSQKSKSQNQNDTNSIESMTVDKIKFGQEFIKEKEVAEEMVKTELIYHYYSTNIVELDQLDGISEVPRLWERIENEKPQVVSFFGLAPTDTQDTA